MTISLPKSQKFLAPHLVRTAEGFVHRTKWARLLAASHLKLVGRPLLPESTENDLDHALFHSDKIALLSHVLPPPDDTSTKREPVFNYGNLRAQRLFEMSWAELTNLPSRESAPGPEHEKVSLREMQAERAMLLERVARDGYIDDYSGVRVSSSGRLFRIQNATVWNVYDEESEESRSENDADENKQGPRVIAQAAAFGTVVSM